MTRSTVDYRNVPFAVGQHVTYYDDKEARFYTAVVKLIGQEQAVLGTMDDDESDIEYTLVKGELAWPDGPRGDAVLKFMTLVSLPEGQMK